MEVRSYSYPNAGAKREADKVFNPEIKEFFAPPAAEMVSGDSISPVPSSAGVADVAGANAPASSAANTDTGSVPVSTFTFHPLTNDLNTAPSDTPFPYPNFPSFGDSVPSQADTAPILEEETQQTNDSEAFDDMVVLKDGMVTSASLLDGGSGDAFEQFPSSDAHLQHSREAPAPDLSPAENTTPVVTTSGGTDALTDISAKVGMEVPTEGSGGVSDLEPTGVVTEEPCNELPSFPDGGAEVAPSGIEQSGVEPLHEEQVGPGEANADELPTPDVIVTEFETTSTEIRVVSSELLPEKLPEDEQVQLQLPQEQLPSIDSNPPEGEHTLQEQPAVERKEVSEEDVQALKGQKVRKKFGKKTFLGDVVDYDSENKWFKVIYEDGDVEDMELDEVKLFLAAPGTSSSSKKKRPHTEGGADEEFKKSSKKPKKMGAETPKSTSTGRQGSLKKMGRPATKTPARSKSPGSKVKSTKKSTARKPNKAARTPKSPGKRDSKVESKTKSEEVSDSPSFKTPVPSQTKKSGKGKAKRAVTPKSRKTGSSKSRNFTKVSRGLDLNTPEAQKMGNIKKLTDSSGKKMGKNRWSFKSPGSGIKVEDTPKGPKGTPKRKADGEELADVKSKRLKRGAEEDIVTSGWEGEKVGEATFIGKPIRKDFNGTLYDGVVVNYDKKTKYFKVKYEDDDQEDLEWRELELILVSEGKSDVDTEAKPAKVSSLSSLMSQKKKTGTSSAKKKKVT